MDRLDGIETSAGVPLVELLDLDFLDVGGVGEHDPARSVSPVWRNQFIQYSDLDTRVGAIAVELSQISADLADLQKEVRPLLLPATIDALGVLVTLFGVRNEPGGNVFAHILINDVLAMQPSVAALIGGCRQIRHTWTGMPSIVEVLTIIEKIEKAWRRAWNACGALGTRLSKAVNRNRRAPEPDWQNSVDDGDQEQPTLH